MGKYGTDKVYLAFPHGDCPQVQQAIYRRLVELGWESRNAGVVDCGTTVHLQSGSIYKTTATIAETGDGVHHVGSLRLLFDGDYYRRAAPFPEHVRLNAAYEAVVTQSCVRVQCQQFTFEAVKSLYDCVQRARAHVLEHRNTKATHMRKYGTDKKYVTFPHGGNTEIKQVIYQRLLELGWRSCPGASGTTIDLAGGQIYMTGAATSEAGNAEHHVGSLDKLFNDNEFYRRHSEFSERVSLNLAYSAAVLEDKVAVDCQEFSFDAVDRLYASVQRARAHNRQPK